MAFVDNSSVEPPIFFIEKISFSLILFSGHFYGQSSIKTSEVLSRLRYDLPISVIDRMISPFCEDFIFTKLRICEVSRK